MVFSSDTNVWIDLEQLKIIQLPFKSLHEFYMYKNAIEDEILSPPDLGQYLLKLGLKGIDITVEELYSAGELQAKYRALSRYDAIALAVAMKREWVLLCLTGPPRH